MNIGEPTSERVRKALTDALDIKIEAFELGLKRLHAVREWQANNPDAPDRVLMMLVSGVRQMKQPNDLLM